MKCNLDDNFFACQSVILKGEKSDYSISHFEATIFGSRAKCLQAILVHLQNMERFNVRNIDAGQGCKSCPYTAFSLEQ